MSKLIVMEGACDGIGKTTQVKLLKEHLEQENIKITQHHFPTYNTYQGKPVEEYLKGTFGSPDQVSPFFVNTLYAIDRAITWNTELKDKEGIVLLDRYTTSSLIYQSALIKNLEEKKKFIDYVCDFEYDKLGIKEPDKTIFLHADFDLVRKQRENRKQNDGIANDIHEANLEFMRNVYESAMFVADYLNWNMIKCDNEDSLKSIEEIHNKVYSLVR